MYMRMRDKIYGNLSKKKKLYPLIIHMRRCNKKHSPIGVEILQIHFYHRGRGCIFLNIKDNMYS